MRVIWHIAARWFEARSSRALRKHFELKEKAEVFFRKIRERADG